jgi:hypothetical protein
MTEARADEKKLKVFISYSRKDLAFAQRIVAALEARLVHKIDTRALPDLEDWRRELLGFIREADAVVFIVSPHPISARVCSWEVEQVANLSKRLAPIVFEHVADDRIPEAIAKINYLFFDQPDDFEPQADKLVRTLQTDLAWLKEHTRLAELARRWDGTKQKVAFVTLQNENGKPTKVLKIEGRIFKFDEAGRIDKACRRSIAQLSPDSRAATNDTVTRDNRWQLTKGERDRVAVDIWQQSNAQSVKGNSRSVPYETPARSSVRQHSLQLCANGTNSCKQVVAPDLPQVVFGTTVPANSVRPMWHAAFRISQPHRPDEARSRR